MFRAMLKSKIHSATITDKNLKYTGSIVIDSALLKAVDIYEGEKVQVVNLNNGERYETYVIAGKPNSGDICPNGAAARLGEVGDKLIIIAYASYSEEDLKKYCAKVAHLDEKNKIRGPEVLKRS